MTIIGESLNLKFEKAIF